MVERPCPSEAGCFGQVDAKAIAAALIFTRHFGRSVAQSQWGRIGYKGRQIIELHRDRDSAMRAFSRYANQKQRRGYRPLGQNARSPNHCCASLEPPLTISRAPLLLKGKCFANAFRSRQIIDQAPRRRHMEETLTWTIGLDPIDGRIVCMRP
jgi:predicted DNA-binding WGR domain protein